RNSRDTTVNETAHWEDAIRPATIANLSAGEFVGVVADDPDRELRLKAFHARVMRDEDGKAAHNNISPHPLRLGGTAAARRWTLRTSSEIFTA
ncbi:MAG TPA: hypothetical protein VGR89_17070, partial [Puia sp.]|nr:hypothetical protein [Puia sp.]